MFYTDLMNSEAKKVNLALISYFSEMTVNLEKIYLSISSYYTRGVENVRQNVEEIFSFPCLEQGFSTSALLTFWAR